MTFAVRLSANAQHDFYQAQEYYDAEAPHETEHFTGEFFATSRRLAEFPYSAPEIRRGARRASLNVFPHQLWYRVRDEAKVIEIIEIIAILHYRQGPARLDERLRGDD